MANRHTITLKPLNISIEVTHGTSLQDVLFPHGVEFPCGGRQRCTGCRVKVLDGPFPVTPEQEALLSKKELDNGWRLACSGIVTGDIEIELAQWEASVLTDNSSFAFKPKEGFGVAVDIGTTTIVGQLLNLSNGNVLAVKTALNNQAQYGADIMERINYAISTDAKVDLGIILRSQIETLLIEMVDAAGIPRDDIRTVLLVGNTVMQHFFCGFDIIPLSRVPFEPEAESYWTAKRTPAELGWKFNDSTSVVFLPSLGGFVGSDILAGIFATEIYKRNKYSCMIDLGTNGEIVIGNKERMLCASTAAGPAFEGARISMGMRASTGAISAVQQTNGMYTCSVIGGGEQRGICGSGLVDAVSVGLRQRRILSSGRFSDTAKNWKLVSPVILTQSDIRELQLAKGAIAAGITILLKRMNSSIENIANVYMAGAFGNYINRDSARDIGLLPFPTRRISPRGNTALLGAKRALFLDDIEELQHIQHRTEHISLNSHPEFMDIFAQKMTFPEF